MAPVPSSAPRIAAIDDDPGVLELIRSVLETEGLALDGFSDGRTFLERTDPALYDVILCDLNLPEWSGIEMLREIRDRTSRPRVAIVTGFASVPSAVTAMKEGAADYIVKPFRIDELLSLVHRLAGDPGGSPDAPEADDRTDGVVGRSRAIRELLEKCRRVAQLPATVLLRGETGAGKDVVARYISSRGPRAGKAFVALNCSTLPENLVESELFGHVKGAFSGATMPRRGLFEEAHGGTLFLDEIGTLTPAAQAKLLRAIEERQFRRVGDNRTIDADVRILAATNVDLEAAIARREFREDLFFRISVVTLTIPPLRERREDIPLLADHFLRAIALPGEAPKRLSKEALELLASYRFPGNVRELKHALEQASAFAAGPELTAADFAALVARREFLPSGEPDVEEERPELTPERIREALEKTRGNRVEAARRLGVSRSTFYRGLARIARGEGTEPS